MAASTRGRRVVDADAALDARLAALGLLRISIPKDGSCLFRAVADAVCLTQALHGHVRLATVQFLRQHQDQFAPFVEGPFDHFLFELSREGTWGGQIELQALSLLYRRNFVVIDRERTTEMDNGFAGPPVRLAFRNGNHYDCVVEDHRLDTIALCQELVYGMVATAAEEPEPAAGGAGAREFRNVGYCAWEDALRDRVGSDGEVARTLGYKTLSGYHQKRGDGRRKKGGAGRAGPWGGPAGPDLTDLIQFTSDRDGQRRSTPAASAQPRAEFAVEDPDMAFPALPGAPPKAKDDADDEVPANDPARGIYHTLQFGAHRVVVA